MTIMNKEEFQAWKQESEILSKRHGHPIKVVNKKYNTLKTIFAILGIISLLFTLAVFTTAQLSERFNLDGDNFVIKVSLDFSQEFKDYVELKINDTMERFENE